MKKNPYFKSALGIYLSYCMLGMILILISSHMTFLVKQLNTDVSGVGFLISVEGIVRSSTLYFAGSLSDKIGRKKFLYIAPLMAIVFLIGVPLSKSYYIAMIFVAFAGISHAFMDAASYASLMECFPETPGTANILIKASVATGGAILPYIISFFVNRNMFYGDTFFVIAVVMVINSIILFNSKFPQANIERSNEKIVEEHYTEEANFKREGIALVIIGFTSNAIFTIFQTWIPTYTQKVLGFNQISSLKFITYYSLGALVSVLILAKLLQKTVKPALITLLYPSVGIVLLLILLFGHVHVNSISIVLITLLGASSAGVLQMAQTTMGELFWKKKGSTIALVSTASGLAAAVIPALTGVITKNFSVVHVFYFMLILYVVGIACGSVVKLRYNKIMRGKIIKEDAI
ncbi:MFS transporter [Clostridium felsineum]|uniref:Inner membrane transport protein YdiM n=1 Tax=Clostridium felsineum TaxID=36839 RepID=A0A1S8MGT2_9CLOT|nr:MFS transporter [Clostridium felsineum]MCR3760850.1 MFS transporter [Clostridium felsineum]URZ03955.1 Inner membrane transport protein YdiM [Clostridium felsineum]URZ07780.1 Inner membrane transport protein YdiM [Clostridium felsineum]URZ12811.1 Inner membrane transport protein YdiM [Clostridium felsineum]